MSSLSDWDSNPDWTNSKSHAPSSVPTLYFLFMPAKLGLTEREKERDCVCVCEKGLIWPDVLATIPKTCRRRSHCCQEMPLPSPALLDKSFHVKQTSSLKHKAEPGPR